eukprot:5866685-Pyramimonas_sp.AAC.2
MPPSDKTRSSGLRSTAAERAAGGELFQELLSLYASCRLNAQQFCVLCDLASKAGVTGASWSTYGKPRGLPTG